MCMQYKKAKRQEAQNGMPESPNASQENRLETKHRKEIRRAVGQCLMWKAKISGIADDDSSALLAEHAPLFGLRAPVPAFLSTEEAEHA